MELLSDTTMKTADQEENLLFSESNQDKYNDEYDEYDETHPLLKEKTMENNDLGFAYSSHKFFNKLKNNETQKIQKIQKMQRKQTTNTLYANATYQNVQKMNPEDTTSHHTDNKQLIFNQENKLPTNKKSNKYKIFNFSQQNTLSNEKSNKYENYNIYNYNRNGFSCDAPTAVYTDNQRIHLVRS